MLPAFALVLALTVVAFGAMVRTAVLRGEAGGVMADHRRGRGDQPGHRGTADASPAARDRGRARRPADRRRAGHRRDPGRQGPLTVVLVSPAGYAALVAGTPFPRFPAGAAGRARRGRAGARRRPRHALASPGRGG